jgi:hypothetical protein
MRRPLTARQALGTQPVQQRSRNFYTAAFAAHRDCSVHSMTYEGDTVTCTECGNKWVITRDSRGEPVGYRMLSRVNTAMFV